MPTPPRYPDYVGNRAGFTSVILKIDGQEFSGFKEVKFTRKRERGMVYGNNADPIGKTRGKNSYEASVTVFVAEFHFFFVTHFGTGYGDRSFTAELTITENGYDTQTHYAYGCTVDETELSSAEGTDAIAVPVALNPIKIEFAGVNDNARALRASPAVG